MKTIVKFPLVIRLQVAAREMIVLNCVHYYIGIYKCTIHAFPHAMSARRVDAAAAVVGNERSKRHESHIGIVIYYTYLSYVWHFRRRATTMTTTIECKTTKHCIIFVPSQLLLRCLFNMLFCALLFVCRFLFFFSSVLFSSMFFLTCFFLAPFASLILRWVECMSLASPLLLLSRHNRSSI